MRRDRAVWAALAVLALVTAAALLRQSGPGVSWLPGCLLHDLTGLHCPGCGMTRTAHASLHGRISEAFRLNPVGMVLLPLAGAGVGLEIAGWVRGRPLPIRLHLGVAGGWVILALVVSFWVFRNIPQWPFTLLAPP